MAREKRRVQVRGVSSIYKNENVYGKPKKKHDPKIAPDSEHWQELQKRLNRDNAEANTKGTRQSIYKGVRELTPYEREFFSRQESQVTEKALTCLQIQENANFLNSIRNAAYVTFGIPPSEKADHYILGHEVLLKNGIYPDVGDNAESFVKKNKEHFKNYLRLNKFQKAMGKRKNQSRKKITKT